MPAIKTEKCELCGAYVVLLLTPDRKWVPCDSLRKFIYFDAAGNVHTAKGYPPHFETCARLNPPRKGQHAKEHANP